jgi:DNA-directed RNA polymerase specialized sigma subunit
VKWSKMVVSDNEIIAKYFRNSKGIRGVAKLLGVSVVRVSIVIQKYKKKKHIR